MWQSLSWRELSAISCDISRSRMKRTKQAAWCHLFCNDKAEMWIHNQQLHSHTNINAIVRTNFSLKRRWNAMIRSDHLQHLLLHLHKPLTWMLSSHVKREKLNFEWFYRPHEKPRHQNIAVPQSMLSMMLAVQPLLLLQLNLLLLGRQKEFMKCLMACEATVLASQLVSWWWVYYICKYVYN